MNDPRDSRFDRPRPVASVSRQPQPAQDESFGEDQRTEDERIDALIVGYQHGMDNNSPRNPAELAEIRSLLGRDDPEVVEAKRAEIQAQRDRAAEHRAEAKRQADEKAPE